MSNKPIWDFELAGFRNGDFSFLSVGKSGDLNGLYMLHPYHPKMIPVMLVHGTASSPARWAEMASELHGDPAIASHYQLWFFIYNSGNPIPLSAMRLRESLIAVRKDVEPNYRGEQVYLYRVRIPASQARALLVDYLEEVNRLADHPRWYNALTQNCTTTIRNRVRNIGAGGRLDWRLLANGHLGQLLYERGQIDTDLSFADLRAHSNITESAKAAGDSPDFSARIRQGLPENRGS